MNAILKKTGIILIVAMLTLVAAWSIQARQITYTYDGQQYTVGVGPTGQTVGGYYVVPSTNYKAYRLGARETPYTYTAVDVSPTIVTEEKQVPIVEPARQVVKEEIAHVPLTEKEPIVLKQGEEYNYNEREYQAKFPDQYSVEQREVVNEPASLSQETTETQQAEDVNYQDEKTVEITDQHERDYEQDVNHYHTINRYHKHYYTHNLKQVHHHYYNVVDHHQNIHQTKQQVEQVYHEPTYDITYEEPVYEEPETTEENYEVTTRTYEIPVQRVTYRPVITQTAILPQPYVAPMYYPTPRYYEYYGGGYNYPYYGNYGYGSGWNWRYATAWN